MTAILILTGIGVLIGVILGVIELLFKSEDDSLLKLVTEALPGYNCGACGYAGCSAYAKAVVDGEVTNKCRPGREETRVKLERIMTQGNK